MPPFGNGDFGEGVVGSDPLFLFEGGGGETDEAPMATVWYSPCCVTFTVCPQGAGDS